MWLTHSDCKNMVQSAWNIHTQGSRAFKLHRKITNVKKQFTNWNKKVFGKVEKEIKEKQQKLQDLQYSIQTIADVN